MVSKAGVRIAPAKINIGAKRSGQAQAHDQQRQPRQLLLTRLAVHPIHRAWLIAIPIGLHVADRRPGSVLHRRLLLSEAGLIRAKSIGQVVRIGGRLIAEARWIVEAARRRADGWRSRLRSQFWKQARPILSRRCWLTVAVARSSEARATLCRSRRRPIPKVGLTCGSRRCTWNFRTDSR